MLTFTIGKSSDVPSGEYIAKFMGLEMLEEKTPRMGRDGKPMAPAMAWRFEIAHGDMLGKSASRITGRNPTSKNVAGRMLSAITGQWLQEGKEVTLAPCVGKLYRIIVEPGEDPSKTRVADNPAPSVYVGPPLAASAPPVASAPPAAPPPLPGQPATVPPPVPAPPPVAPPVPPAAPPVDRQFWVIWNPADPAARPEQAFESALIATLKAKAQHPQEIRVCVLGEQTWKSGKEAGIYTDIPW